MNEAIEEAIYLVRLYEPSDYAMIGEWAKGHGKAPPPEAILPKLGVVVREIAAEMPEDVAALWLYMDNSVGVCFAEHAITRPKLSLRRAKLALLRAVDCLRSLARSHGYGVMVVHTVPGISRYLEKNDFHLTNRKLNSLCAITK